MSITLEGSPKLSTEEGEMTTQAAGGNADVCGAESFMLRDGVCDEATNTQICHWDDGDCCLDQFIKDESLCQVNNADMTYSSSS